MNYISDTYMEMVLKHSDLLEKDIRFKDKALHKKSKLIRRLREENVELVKENESLRYNLLKQKERDAEIVSYHPHPEFTPR